MHKVAEVWLLASVVGMPLSAMAEPLADRTDRFELRAHGESHVALFRRALLPGPNGELVETRTVVPMRHDVRLVADAIDSPWDQDSLSVELSAWGASGTGIADDAPLLDGDVQTANVGYRRGPLVVRLGRQHTAGGAARYVRFDGARVDAAVGAGFEVIGYGGLTVLPRWDQQPGYFALDAGTAALRRSPTALPEAARERNWLAGGRLGWRDDHANAALSFHEQRQDEGLAREDLGANVGIVPTDWIAAGGAALLELDSVRLSDARAWVDVSPVAALDTSVEYLHTEPALLLSRQSVVAVFSTSAYDELGGAVVARPLRSLTLEGGGFLQVYDSGHPGARGELAIRAVTDRRTRTVLRIGYTRVLAPDNGYHGLRSSLSRPIIDRLFGTLDVYAYVYDAAIRGVTVSTVYAGTLTWQVARPLSALAGASVTRSPYAELDAQAQVRLAYDFDFSTRGQP